METSDQARFFSQPRKPNTPFDVVCAGEVAWNVAPAFRVRAGGGAVNIAVALRSRGLDVGLATALADDAPARALVSAIAARGVDVGGVALNRSASALYVVDGKGDAQSLVAHRAESPPIEMPSNWSARLLLLSGLAPGVSYAASLCKAARAARRAGTYVVVDVNARWYLWADQDPRATLSVLREADVVRVSGHDLEVLEWTEATVERAMRPKAVLVSTQGVAFARALGPFGEIVKTVPAPRGLPNPGSSDAFTGALCAALARNVDRAELPAVWEEALTSSLIASVQAAT